MKVDKYDTAGKRLRYFREEEAGESREKFSEGLDITPRTLERYENDESSPDASFLAKLNVKYQGMLNLDWLLTGRGSLYMDKTNHGPGKIREDTREYHDVMLEKMHQQLDRVYRQKDFLKLAALQSLLNLLDREKENYKK